MLYRKNISNSSYCSLLVYSDSSHSTYTKLKINISIQIIFDKSQRYSECNFTDKEIAQLKAIYTQASDQELINSLTDIQFLASSWLDECEKMVFNGLTLTELLHEKGKL